VGRVEVLSVIEAKIQINEKEKQKTRRGRPTLLGFNGRFDFRFCPARLDLDVVFLGIFNQLVLRHRIQTFAHLGDQKERWR
jgi:hypothetical protein